MTSELSLQRNDAITYFTCRSIFRHWTVLPKSFMGALSSNSRLDVRKSVSALSRYFGMKFLWLEIGKKIDNLDIRPL